jgi:hypothetical protein
MAPVRVYAATGPKQRPRPGWLVWVECLGKYLFAPDRTLKTFHLHEISKVRPMYPQDQARLQQVGLIQQSEETDGS